MKLSRNIHSAKYALKERLQSVGYDIVRSPGVDYPKIDYLELLADRLNLSGEPVQVMQIGANDGVDDDSLRALLLGNPHWQAVLVEPQVGVFAELKKNYAVAGGRVAFENVAIADGGDALTFYTIDHPTDQSLTVFSSTIRENVSKNNPYSDDYIVEVQVPCRTVSQLIEDHGMPQLDLLVIDTEGYDFEVIKTVDFARHKPRMIQFESGHLKREERREVFTMLADLGYALQWNGQDSFAILQESHQEAAA